MTRSAAVALDSKLNVIAFLVIGSILWLNIFSNGLLV